MLNVLTPTETVGAEFPLDACVAQELPNPLWRIVGSFDQAVHVVHIVGIVLQVGRANSAVAHDGRTAARFIGRR